MNNTIYYTLNKLNALLKQTPPSTIEKIVLIGGQALIAWVQVFNIEELTGEEFVHLASDDMDFMGSIHVFAALNIIDLVLPKLSELYQNTF